MVAFAQTIIILTSGIDLSVGAIVSLANVICAAVMTNEPWGFLKGVLIALIAGVLTGAFNGFIVSKGRIQPIIVTLATSAIYGGIALMILPRPGGTVHVGFARTLTGSILGISTPSNYSYFNWHTLSGPLPGRLPLDLVFMPLGEMN